MYVCESAASVVHNTYLRQLCHFTFHISQKLCFEWLYSFCLVYSQMHGCYMIYFIVEIIISFIFADHLLESAYLACWCIKTVFLNVIKICLFHYFYNFIELFCCVLFKTEQVFPIWECVAVSLFLWTLNVVRTAILCAVIE